MKLNLRLKEKKAKRYNSFLQKTLVIVCLKTLENQDLSVKMLKQPFFFPNQDSTRTKIIKKILVPTNDYKIIKSLQSGKTSKRKNAKYSPFKINLYTIDSIIGIPKDKIFEEYFVIKCAVNENYAILELDENEVIEFPKNGFFVVIKNLTIEERKELGYDFAPGIEQIGVSKNNKFSPYFRYLHQGEDAKWNKSEYLINRTNIYNIGIEFKEIK